jgi:outer membrane murein-binding lipoprotein Lpp
MSNELEKTSSAGGDASDGIKLEPSPFEQSFQPGSLPKISVPDLPEDAVGLSAEALAQVPTLTEQVEAADSDVAAEASPDAEMHAEISPEVPTEGALIQDTPVEADTGGEQFHVRMDKLTDQIHALNARLDRLAEKINLEV